MSRDLLGEHAELRWQAYRAALAVAPLLPLQALRFAAYVAAVVFRTLDRGGRAHVRAHLQRLLPVRPGHRLRRLVDRAYVSFAFTLAENSHLVRAPASHAALQRVDLCDPYRVFARRPLPGPAIVVTVHVNWELAAAALHALGLVRGMRTLARGHGDRRIDRLYDRVRARHGHRSLALEGAPLAALRSLREGGVLGIVGDRDYSRQGLEVRFGRGRTRLPIGPAALAIQIGCPVIPVLLARRPCGRFTLLVDRPLRPAPGADKRRELPHLAQELADRLARLIAAVPEQWCAFHG